MTISTGEAEKAHQHAGSKRLKGKSYRDAQEEPASTSTSKIAVDDGVSEEKPAKVFRPSGRKVEVVIPRFFPTSSDTESADEAPAPKAPSRPARRKTTASRRAIEISDDEAAGDQSSDYHASPPTTEVEDVTSPDDSFAESDEDDKPAPKQKVAARKGKQSAAAKGRRKAISSDDDSSDVKKRKASGDGGKATKRRKVTKEKETKPKKNREESDPWHLKKTRDDDWADMRCPPLEMFHFARKVVDEYTYLSGRALSMVTKISADRHWVLSGTPPTHNFAAVKFIAQFLNIHLGVDDEGDGHEKSQEMKKRRSEQTGKIRSYDLCLVLIIR
jgi:hypothetical protein